MNRAYHHRVVEWFNVLLTCDLKDFDYLTSQTEYMPQAFNEALAAFWALSDD